MNGYTLESVLEEGAALLVVDMQNDFVHDRGAVALAGNRVKHYQRLVPTVRMLRGAAREASIPIWLIGMSHNEENDGDDAWTMRRRGRGHPNTCRTGTWGQRFYEGVEPEQEDQVFWKHRYSAFTGTDLQERLQTQGIRTLVLVGLNTNTCVESTAREAHLLGFHVVVVRDATACQFEDAFEPSLTNIHRHFGIVAQSEDVRKCWKETAKNGVL
ncbi:cysteine hydrolase family protein [Cohnella thailandensis]|uniref:Cysteine hydrolase n=1 Tax=Cohnella thailandensis TaxID=557557 RepID=A0A841T372_9BACL|nr:isochorismatase family cysteine hydrolase [Cohnella thailandensis]MBB6636500.1 cysteine hydrolase [Cohnella thailandensis]MBP1977628.1 ureidoacrylate peracid hydrolase [Cohnella thailandensis]